MKGSRFTETQNVSILKEADAGMQVKEVCPKQGILNRATTGRIVPHTNHKRRLCDRSPSIHRNKYWRSRG